MTAPNLEEVPLGLPPHSLSLGGARHGITRWLGPVGLLVILACTAVPGVIAPYSPVEIDPQSILVAPNRAHLLGTDANGMDIFSRLIWATRIDITIAILSTVIALSLGTLVGAWAGFEFGRPTIEGRLSNTFMRLVDAV